MKFRKKPVVIEAFQVGFDKEPEWFQINKQVTEGFRDDHSVTYIIKTLEGDMQATFGDWVIKGVKGEIYPCKTDIFEMTYEPYAELQTAEEYFKNVALERQAPDEGA